MKIAFAFYSRCSLQLLEVFQIYAFIKYLNVYFQGGNILSAQSCTSEIHFVCRWGDEFMKGWVKCPQVASHRWRRY